MLSCKYNVIDQYFNFHFHSFLFCNLKIIITTCLFHSGKSIAICTFVPLN